MIGDPEQFYPEQSKREGGSSGGRNNKAPGTSCPLELSPAGYAAQNYFYLTSLKESRRIAISDIRIKTFQQDKQKKAIQTIRT
jgi:hypothetical protein